MLGKAIDFHIPGVPVEQLRAAGMRLQRGGVGFYPGSFVHVDVGSVRHWPRMTHDQLARVFPNGRTVHVPSNGQPLSGYALALADIEKRGSSAPSGMSLAAARNAGAIGDDEERVASAAKPRKGNVLAKLFGFSTDEDEDEDSRPAPQSRVAAVATKPAVEAKIPLPQARPAAIAQKPAGGFALASATSTPFSLPVAQRAAPAGRGQRADRSSPPRARRPRASRPGSMTRNSAAPTASRPAWRSPMRRMPRPTRSAPGRAHAADGRRTPAPAPAATTQIARIPPKAGQRYNDPWMRGITLATSVHHEMNVTVYGRLDVRQVRMMMIKPVTSLPMTFGSRSL